MQKKRSDYMDEIKDKYDIYDKKALIESVIHIKELECENKKLEDKLSKCNEMKDAKWTFWNNTSYISTLLIILSFILFILYYFIPYKQNIITQKNNEIKTLQQRIKDCNCTHP